MKTNEISKKPETIVQALESSAINIVDTVEKKTVAAIASVEDQVQSLEKKAADFVGNLEDQAISAVDRLDEVPKAMDKAVRANPYIAIGVSFGVGVALRLLQSSVSPETMRKAAREGASYLGKNAASWALQTLIQKQA